MKFLNKGVINFCHFVSESPWPILGSLGGLVLTSSLVNWIYFKTTTALFLGLFIMILVMLGWWLKVMEEGLEGSHNKKVQTGLRFGMILFILSEVMFFFSFFWAFFHMCWGGSPEVGFVFPPANFVNMLVDPFSVPLFNSMMLLSSGVFVTWSHKDVINQGKNITLSLLFTVLLGVMFLINQGLEYNKSFFGFNSLSYGSCFYILTGFHGFHVFMGTVFLFICSLRSWNKEVSSEHHLGFEFAMWYWHFVDVVWLFLYVSIYWYGFSI